MPRGKTKKEMLAMRPGNPALKHGLYSRMDPARIDKRTKLFRYIQNSKDKLAADLGGNLTCQQSLLLDRAIFKAVKLASFENETMGGMDHGDRTWGFYISLANSLRLDLALLGLERKARDITPLRERLAALEQEQENEHGKEEAETQTSETGQAG